MLPKMNHTNVKETSPLPSPACLDSEFLDSPFLRWIALADSLLNKPRETENEPDFSN